MTSPKRFLDSQSDADDFERAVLRAELEAAPPAEVEGDVLARVLSAVLPVVPAAAGPVVPVEPATGAALGAGTLAKGAVTLATLGKGFALGIGVSVAAATGSHFLGEKTQPSGAAAPHGASVETARRADARPAPIERAVTPPNVPGETRSDDAEPRAAVNAAPRNGALVHSGSPAIAARSAERAPSAPSVASFPAAAERTLAASRLQEEAALLRRARSELRAGALAAAFATLEASRQKFTAPELSQEREALAIELLYRSGERAAAATRAREFLKRFPESPHAVTIRAFAGGPR